MKTEDSQPCLSGGTASCRPIVKLKALLPEAGSLPAETILQIVIL